MKKFKTFISFIAIGAFLITGCTKNLTNIESTKEKSVSLEETFDWSHKGKSIDQILNGPLMQPVDNIEWPISKEKITLKILKPAMANDSVYSDMDMMKDYEKQTNIFLKWNTPPVNSFRQQFNLILNSGSDLPDFVIAPPQEQIEKYGQLGVFIALNDLIENHMPNLKNAFGKRNKQMIRDIKSSDGKIYCLPQLAPLGDEPNANNIMVVREDWLEKLNLSMPETIDDWYNVFKAFKTKDPNGNGKADEWPFSGAGANGTGLRAARSFAIAWGVFEPLLSKYDGFYVADKMYPYDGKIHYGPIQDRYREAMEWVIRVYSQGFIDPEILTNNGKAFQSRILQNIVGSSRTFVNGGLANVAIASRNLGESVKMREAPIIKGPYGDQIHPYNVKSNLLTNAMAITNTNKYPVETVKWADYWYSENGATYTYGIEGITYYRDEYGTPHWTEYAINNPDEKTVHQVRGVISPTRSTWPGISIPSCLVAEFYEFDFIEEYRRKYRDSECFVQPVPQGMSYTTEENMCINQLISDITTYVDEVLTKFILGKIPLNDNTWKEYVDTVISMGVKEILEIKQASYGRYTNRQ